MPQCQHVETQSGSGIWICPTCNHKALSSHAPSRECGQRVATQLKAPRRIAAPGTSPERIDPGPCVFRGEILESNLICKLCGAKGETYDVYDCSKHGRCSLAKRDRGLKSCAGCQDHCSPEKATRDGLVKVVLIAPALHNPGGIERWLVAMARYLPLVSSGCVVVSSVVIKFPDAVDPEMLAELSQVARVQVYQHDNEASRRATLAVVNAADVAIVSGMGDLSWCIDGFRGPVVWLSHSCCHWSEKFSREAQAAGLVTHWASVGHLAKGVFPDELLDQVTAIENGAEIDRVTPVRGRAWQREQWGLTDDQIAVLFVGRLCDEKRPIALAEAIAHLPLQFVGIMVGSGIHETQTVEACQRIAGDRVRFVGRCNPLGDALAAGDVGFLASGAEGFCLSRAEMQLAGLPMVSTPTGELPRLETEHGPLAWSIPIGATGPQMATVIQQAVSDPQMTQSIAARAKGLAWDRYTAAAMAGRWADYIDSMGVG